MARPDGRDHSPFGPGRSHPPARWRRGGRRCILKGRQTVCKLVRQEALNQEDSETMSEDFGTILVPTDFSDCAAGALDAALALAEKKSAPLVLLHAIVLHGDDPYNPARYFDDREALFERLGEEAKSRIAALESGWSERSVTVRSELRRGIHAAPVILEAAEELDAGLIVIGTHGRRGPSRWLLGSVAEEVVRAAPCPVLTVRQQDPPQTLQSVERILVPIDFSEASEPTLAHARRIARRFGARLALLHLVEPVAVPGPYGSLPGLRPMTLDYDALAAGAKEKLEDLMHSTRTTPAAEDVPFKTYSFCGVPRMDIVGFAGQLRADLIVIGSHGRTGLPRLLLGSTAEQVVRTADCPVLVVKTGPDEVDEDSTRKEPYPGLEDED